MPFPLCWGNRTHRPAAGRTASSVSVSGVRHVKVQKCLCAQIDIWTSASVHRCVQSCYAVGRLRGDVRTASSDIFSGRPTGIGRDMFTHRHVTQSAAHDLTYTSTFDLYAPGNNPLQRSLLSTDVSLYAVDFGLVLLESRQDCSLPWKSPPMR
jgi:hypothetical protein